VGVCGRQCGNETGFSEIIDFSPFQCHSSSALFHSPISCIYRLLYKNVAFDSVLKQNYLYMRAHTHVYVCFCVCRTHWPRGIKRGSAASGMLGRRIRIRPGALMSVSCECCAGRCLCDRLSARLSVIVKLRQ
jgi:hypothetical protein